MPNSETTETTESTAVTTPDGLHVHMANDETGGRWECPVDYVPVALQRGWSYTDPTDHSLDGLFDPADVPQEGDVEQTGFDPFDHTVAEVNEYLDQYRDNAPGEVERVLGLERAGKNRVGVVGSPDAADEDA